MWHRLFSFWSPQDGGTAIYKGLTRTITVDPDCLQKWSFSLPFQKSATERRTAQAIHPLSSELRFVASHSPQGFPLGVLHTRKTHAFKHSTAVSRPKWKSPMKTYFSSFPVILFLHMVWPLPLLLLMALVPFLLSLTGALPHSSLCTWGGH